MRRELSHATTIQKEGKVKKKTVSGAGSGPSVSEIRWPQANRLVLGFNPAPRIIRSISFRVGQETDRPQPPLRTQIEPVPNAAPHGKKISRLKLNHHHGAAPGMNVAHAASRNNQMCLILVVPVLFAESCQHFVQLRG